MPNFTLILSYYQNAKHPVKRPFVSVKVNAEVKQWLLPTAFARACYLPKPASRLIASLCVVLQQIFSRTSHKMIKILTPGKTPSTIPQTSSAFFEDHCLIYRISLTSNICVHSKARTSKQKICVD